MEGAFKVDNTDWIGLHHIWKPNANERKHGDFCLVAASARSPLVVLLFDHVPSLTYPVESSLEASPSIPML